jgi:hypothetical protein
MDERESVQPVTKVRRRLPWPLLGEVAGETPAIAYATSTAVRLHT